MSLDVYLKSDLRKEIVTCHCCGHSREEEVSDTLFDSNITHNLGRMAEAAGIYKHCWRPEEIGILKASQLIQPLEDGLQKLKSDPDAFKVYNASNGWGLYEHFVPWVEEYLKACKEYPDANVSAYR
jgi:hypothetical protein